jgi:hypothetical protein
MAFLTPVSIFSADADSAVALNREAATKPKAIANFGSFLMIRSLVIVGCAIRRTVSSGNDIPSPVRRLLPLTEL